MSDDTPDLDFTAPDVEEIGELLPAYEVHYFIAQGGMGAVYMARQKSLDRDVAIKILPRHFGEDEGFRTSFEAEAKSMAKLNHPNLISIYDFGQIDEQLWIIMELVQGKSLYHSAYGNIIDPSEAGRIATEICYGLGHAHEHGILHRDIKPANILLDPNASPKIGDFGLAQPVDDVDSGISFGTPGYSAPEVIHNPGAVDKSTDLFSVGVILYELLTGHLPEKSYSPAASEVKCDPGYDRIIRKATHPTPALRYRDAESMADDIKSVMDAKPQENSTLITVNTKQSSSSAKMLVTGAQTIKKAKQSPATKMLVTGAHEAKATKALKLKTNKSSDSGKNTTSVSAKSSLGNRPSSPTIIPQSANANAPLIKNIIIIIALLAAIFVAWEGYKIMRDKRDAEQQLIDEEKAKREAEAKAKRELEFREKQAAIAARQPHRRPVGHTPEDLQPKSETPMETLARLQSSLFQGKRNEMPKSTILDGARARFYISTPMTWHAAQEFCEQHGGHLSVFQEPTDLRKFTRLIESDISIWLGAGTAGDREWRWIDDSPWKQEIRKTSKAAYVSVNDTGILKPQPAQTPLPFFIEWMMDGSSPGSLEMQLKRCADSISAGSPQYPAGTISYDNRYYLHVERGSDWQAARGFATTAAGVLAVPSNPDENIWISTFLQNRLNPNQACWIGGIHPANTTWKWATGEPWAFASWNKDAPNENTSRQLACAILASGKWDDFTSFATLGSFLIEWSKDGQGMESVETRKIVPADPVAPIRAQCATILKAIEKRYEKEYHNNIKGFEQELRTYHRSLVVSQQKALGPGIIEIQNRYKNGRIPDNLPIQGMPQKLHEIVNSRVDKQSRIQIKYLGDVENIRKKYRANLVGISEKLSTQGLVSRVKKVEDELSDTQEGNESFVRHILNN